MSYSSNYIQKHYEGKSNFDEKSFLISGISYNQNTAFKINNDDILDLIPEPENKYDNKAICIYYHNEKVGYVPKDYKYRNILENNNQVKVINKKLVTDNNTVGLRVLPCLKLLKR